MQPLIVTVGLQGSGKTTWTMAQIEQAPIGSLGRVGRDPLRIMSHGGWKGTKEAERQITIAQGALVDVYIQNGLDVIVDDTNMHGEQDVLKWLEIAYELDIKLRIVDFLDVSLEECMRRNDLRRSDHVPQSAIYQTWGKLHDSMFPYWRDERPHEDHEVIAKYRTYVQEMGIELVSGT